jgi:hypothetical protein
MAQMDIRAQLVQLEAENRGLKAKLGEVSRALLSATEATVGVTVGAKPPAWAPTVASGRSGLKSTEAERQLRKVHVQINELHRENEKLHLKTDSVVLSNRLQHLEEVQAQQIQQIQQVSTGNKALKLANYKFNVKAEEELKGRGAKYAFDRDYRYITQENTSLVLKLKETAAKNEKLEHLGQKQETKIMQLENEIRFCGKDLQTIHDMKIELAAVKELKKEREKLKKDTEILHHHDQT